MKRFAFIAALAALILGACSKSEITYTQSEANAVSFGAYSGRTVTKAGTTDPMDLAALKTNGFGVFATYTGTDAFEDLANDKGATDDFMYNQLVNHDGTSWTYSPIKYWPNPTNGQAAADQKVSFFAYAPYAVPSGANDEIGITGFSKAVAADDPKAVTPVNHVHDFVHYTFSMDKPNVDLMWGYKAKDATNPASVTYTINNNLTRRTETVHFVFQHLFSKLGGSQEGAGADSSDPYTDNAYVANGLVVKANPVSLDPTNGFGTDDGTKITISKIVVGSAPKIDAISGQPVTDIDGNAISYATADIKGKLDLYTGVFTTETTALTQFSQTITNLVNDPSTAYDESHPDSELADFLKEPQNFTTFAALPKGVVDYKALNVYKDESNPVILIPGTKPVVDITITYTVRTYDAKLGAKKCSEVPQTVFGRIKFPEIKKNTKYNIVMIIGLNDVKFSAEVEDWTTGVLGQVWTDDDGDGIQDPNEMHDVTDTEIGLPSNL